MSLDIDDYYEKFESPYNDCYVYALVIKDTGEIFFINYDTDEEVQSDEPIEDHRLFIPNVVRQVLQSCETEKRILYSHLREDVAVAYVEAESERIRESTNNMLCDFDTTDCVNRSHYKVGEVPVHEVSCAEEHYLGWKPIEFDPVEIDNLKVVYIDTGFLTREIIHEVYDDKYSEYYNTLKEKLEALGAKVLATKYAKSVTAWVYTGGSILSNYLYDQERATTKLGRRIPSYHLIDVVRRLEAVSTDAKPNQKEEISIHPIHTRCPWRQIKNLNDSHAGFQAGYPFWEQGEILRKQGDLNGAIALFDEARENGYDAPVLYDSYCKAFRKMKDYENEIAIIQEEIERNLTLHENDSVWAPFFLKKREQIEKAKRRLIQQTN